MIFVYNDKFVLHLIGGVAIFPERYIYIYIYMYMIPLVIKNDSFRCVYIMDHVKAES